MDTSPPDERPRVHGAAPGQDPPLPGSMWFPGFDEDGNPPPAPPPPPPAAATKNLEIFPAAGDARAYPEARAVYVPAATHARDLTGGAWPAGPPDRPPGINHRGAWSARTATYSNAGPHGSDVVTHAGCAYVAVAARVPEGTPLTDGACWRLLAAAVTHTWDPAVATLYAEVAAALGASIAGDKDARARRERAGAQGQALRRAELARRSAIRGVDQATTSAARSLHAEVAAAQVSAASAVAAAMGALQEEMDRLKRAQYEQAHRVITEDQTRARTLAWVATTLLALAAALVPILAHFL